jgi:DNA repair exonuclease SbcCD ATPase subunit
MSLAECIAATQAEMKGRIEEECRKQMRALLEDTFAKKWDEYTSKAIITTSATPLYSEGYGKLDINIIPQEGHMTAAVKTVLNTQQALYEFSSKKVYFIHCCTKQTHNGMSVMVDAYFIDNYGFYYRTNASVAGGSYRQPDAVTKIDITKPVAQNGAGVGHYIYPLPNAIIDIIKAQPYSVEPYHSHNGYGNPSSGGDHAFIIKNLPQIRKAAALIHEQSIAFDALMKENEMLEEQLSQADDKSSALTQQYDEQTAVFNVLKGENETLKACISSLEDSSSILAARYEEQTAAFHALKEEHEALKARLSAIENSPLQYNVEVANSSEGFSNYKSFIDLDAEGYMRPSQPQDY